MSQPIVLDFKSWSQFYRWLNEMGKPRATLHNVPCDECDGYADCTVYENGRRICRMCHMAEAYEARTGND